MSKENMQTFIGVKRIKAERVTLGDKDGYAVFYPDGHESWSPKDVFEAAYFPIDTADKISLADVERWNMRSDKEVSTLGAKTTLVKVTMPTGFVDVEASSCVSPENYDEKLGAEIVMEHVTDRVWKMLGFVLQWANHGLNDVPTIK